MRGNDREKKENPVYGGRSKGDAPGVWHRAGAAALLLALIHPTLVHALTRETNSGGMGVHRKGYGDIATRNVFGLKPAPQPAAGVQSNTIPLPKLFLTGITTLLGIKQALIVAQIPPTAPGAPARQESLILAEGQRDGPVEVLLIDEEARTVRVNNAGILMHLDFEKNGVKLASPSGGQSPTGGVANRAASGIPAPPRANPGVQTNAYATPGLNAPMIPAAPGTGTLPSRTARTPNAGVGAASSPTYTSSGSESSTAPPAPLTAEEQLALDEVQRQVSRSNSSPAPDAPNVPVTGLPPVPEGATAPGRTPPLLPQ